MFIFVGMCTKYRIDDTSCLRAKVNNSRYNITLYSYSIEFNLHTLQTSHGPSLYTSHGLVLQTSHGLALQTSHGLALQSSYGPSIQSSHGPSMQSSHGPSMQTSHVPALQTSHVPALQTIDILLQFNKKSDIRRYPAISKQYSLHP